MDAITILEIVVGAFAIWLLVYSSYKAFHSGLRGEPDEIELSKRRARVEAHSSNRGSKHDDPLCYMQYADTWWFVDVDRDDHRLSFGD